MIFSLVSDRKIYILMSGGGKELHLRNESLLPRGCDYYKQEFKLFAETERTLGAEKTYEWGLISSEFAVFSRINTFYLLLDPQMEQFGEHLIRQTAKLEK
jgi:hypothetical protein